MIILSKYKDYYDYLVGIYGVDPKLILDRRNFYVHLPSRDEKVVIFICGKRVEGYFDGEKFIYGEALHKISHKTKKHKYYLDNEITKDHVTIKLKKRELWVGDYINVNTKIVDDTMKLNKKFNCPILTSIHGGDDYNPFPRLDKLNIASIISAEEMFHMLSNWLSMQITNKEQIKDNLTDAQKIHNKGFDIKCSFRPKYNCKH